MVDIVASMFASSPMISGATGVRTPYAHLLPPGSRVAAIVCSAGEANIDEPYLPEQLVPTLAAGLARCRAGRGDVVVVLPGHDEDVGTDMLDNLVDGTRVIGCGCPDQDDAPTFNWVAATDNWALDNKNCLFANLRFAMNQANNITKGITVTGAGNKIIGCYFQTGTGASLDCAIPVSVEAGADNFSFVGNVSRQSGGTTTSVVAAGVVDCLLVKGCDLQQIGSGAAVGCISVTGAATNVRIEDNKLSNEATSSTACVNVTDAASTGMIEYNRMATLNDGTASSQGLILGASSLIKCFENYSCDEPILSAILGPVACT